MIVEKADTTEKYEGLRDLWSRVFGDEPEFVDHVYRTFGGHGALDGSRAGAETDITGYVVCDDAGRALSVLTCYRCGELRIPEQMRGEDEYAGSDGKPVYVSYAVCTDPEYRGQGLAGMLTSHVKESVIQAGGISLVSPAEDSLIDFYSDLGYRVSCFADEETALTDDDADWLVETGADVSGADTRTWGLGPDGSPGFIDDGPFSADGPELSVRNVDVSVYNKYRELFLKDIPHVAFSGEMLELVRSVSLNGDGMLLINGGDAVCVVSETESAADAGEGELQDERKSQLILNELLVNPELLTLSEEIAEEIAAGIAEYVGTDSLRYRTPASGGRCQSMTAGEGSGEFYFGFPLE